MDTTEVAGWSNLCEEIHRAKTLNDEILQDPQLQIVRRSDEEAQALYALSSRIHASLTQPLGYIGKLREQARLDDGGGRKNAFGPESFGNLFQFARQLTVFPLGFNPQELYGAFGFGNIPEEFKGSPEAMYVPDRDNQVCLPGALLHVLHPSGVLRGPFGKRNKKPGTHIFKWGFQVLPG